MTTITLSELGYFSKNQVNRIKEKLEGKTFMKFEISSGGIGTMNQVLTVSTNRPDTPEEELRGMFLNVALNEL